MRIVSLLSQQYLDKKNNINSKTAGFQNKAFISKDSFTFTGQKLPITETTNPKTMDLKSSTKTTEIVKIITKENEKVAPAVEKENEQIAEAVDLITNSFKNGGKLYYFGAGTSGRLGVLDASECPPTFSVSPDLVNGVIAGGDKAITKAVEGAEDNFEAGYEDAERLKESDVAVVVSASGNPAYLMGVIEKAKEKGTKIVGVTCNPEAKIKNEVDTFICPVVGPEVIAGSSRLKAGTAQKMVLNTLTTASMIKMGRFYEGKMIYVSTTNEKLHQRAIRITSEITHADKEDVEKILKENDWSVPLSCLMLKYGLNKEEANRLLRRSNGNLEKAINDHLN